MQDLEGEADPFDIVLEIGKENVKKKILIDKPELHEVNAIKEELSSFYDYIKNNHIPKVSIENGFEAMEVAHEILKKLKNIPFN